MSVRGRLRRLEERVGPPESPGNGEARERVMVALETIHRLILEHADRIDRDYRERVGRGEEPLTALIAVKREALATTEEGRRAWGVAEAIGERGGRGGS